MKTAMILRSATLALLAGLLVLLAAGCGSETNPDFQEPTADYHPFGAIENHGNYVMNNTSELSLCKQCHGADLRGEASGQGGSKVRSCVSAECHNADNHPGMFEAAMQHPQYVESQSFSIDQCLVCHVKTQPAGTPEVFGGSCSSAECHPAAANGPDACNTCHGNFSGDPTVQANWAPPRGIWASQPDDPGIGAHQAHMNVDTTKFHAVTCSECHLVPDQVNTPQHFGDSTPNGAELFFSGISRSGGLFPEYNASNATCSSVYCHGDTEPVWTELDQGWGECGSCHGLPPAQNHVQDNQCWNCHSEVIDSNMNFVDPSLHLDGRVEVQLP